MVSASFKFINARSLRAAQLLIVIFSTMLAVAYVYFQLQSYTKSFVRDFEEQSFIELGRGETLSLARRLGALTKIDQFQCVIGTKAGTVFFEERKGECASSFFSSHRKVEERNNKIEI